MNLPSAFAEPERYTGRPLVLVLENYVLDVIGELEQEKQEGIARLVAAVFGGGDDWRKTVRQQLRLEDAIDNAFREMWRQNQQIAAANNVVLHPVQFAKMVVDKNFADRIAPIALE